MIEIEEIYDKLDWYDRIRCLNFCEIEFGNGGCYGHNNTEEIKEVLLDEFEYTSEEIIDMLYKNEYFNETSAFFYTNGRSLESVSKEMIKNDFDFVTDNICNGELREMIEDMICDDINY